MKLTIRPLVEVNVDGDMCGKDCPIPNSQCVSGFECRLTRADFRYPIRCQDCLDAEKEVV